MSRQNFSPFAVSLMFLMMILGLPVASAATVYTVTPYAGANGSIDPKTPVQVMAGGRTEFTITSKQGYTAKVTGCASSLVTGSSFLYSTGPINDDCAVVAEFNPPPPTSMTPGVTTLFLPAAMVGASYGAALDAAGGQGPYQFSASGLPAGMKMIATGALSGTPLIFGNENVVVTVTDSLNQSSSRTYTLAVLASTAKLTLVTIGLPNGIADVQYEQPLLALGGLPPYRFEATGLPTGLEIKEIPATSTEPPKVVLSGKSNPSQNGIGTFAVVLTVTDAAGHRVSQGMLLTLLKADFTGLEIPNDPKQTLSGALVDKACTLETPGILPSPTNPAASVPFGLLNFAVTGCSSVTLTVAYPGPLPAGTQYWKYGPTIDNPVDHWYRLPGVLIQGNSATITIIDNGLGDSDPTVGRISDPSGPAIPNQPKISCNQSTSQCKAGQAGTAYSATVSAASTSKTFASAAMRQTAAAAGQSYLWNMVSGILPPGLRLDGTTAKATLTGIPTQPGTYVFTVQAIDLLNGNALAQQALSVTIAPRRFRPDDD